MVFSNNVLGSKYSRVRIANALLELAAAGTFRSVTHDKTGVVGVDEANPPKLLGKTCNEMIKTPADVGLNKRHDTLDFTNFQWFLILEFNKEVDTEEFDNLLLTKPIIPSTPGIYERSIVLRLNLVELVHPPAKGSDTGSRVTYTFAASPGRT